MTHKPVRSWPVLLLAAPAFVAIWSGWVGLGGLTGFGVVAPLPGIADGVRLNTAITLPVGMEVYAAFALRVWLSGRVPARARRFAKWSAIGALVLGAFGQVAFHLLVAAGVEAAPWPITIGVSCLPVAVLGMGAALAYLIQGSDEPAAPSSTRETPRMPDTPPLPATGSAPVASSSNGHAPSAPATRSPAAQKPRPATRGTGRPPALSEAAQDAIAVALKRGEAGTTVEQQALAAEHDVSLTTVQRQLRKARNGKVPA